MAAMRIPFNDVSRSKQCTFAQCDVFVVLTSNWVILQAMSCCLTWLSVPITRRFGISAVRQCCTQLVGISSSHWESHYARTNRTDICAAVYVLTRHVRVLFAPLFPSYLSLPNRKLIKRTKFSCFKGTTSNRLAIKHILWNWKNTQRRAENPDEKSHIWLTQLSSRQHHHHHIKLTFLFHFLNGSESRLPLAATPVNFRLMSRSLNFQVLLAAV